MLFFVNFSCISLFIVPFQLLHFPVDQTLSVYPTGFGAAPSPCIKVRLQKTERGKSTLTVSLVE